jgi:hypothetical protein
LPDSAFRKLAEPVQPSGAGVSACQPESLAF